MILSVFGPTASGKSSLGIKLAQDLNGEIINCDSVQLYKGFVIGAAQPTEQEKSLIPHHLFEYILPTESMSVGKYKKLAKTFIGDISARNKLPIIVGGTSLYLTGLLYGLADLQEDESVRRQLEDVSTELLHTELMSADPVSAARIHNNDRQRLLRAVETARLGKKLSDSHIQHQDNIQTQDCLIVVPIWDRASLYQRIDQRTENMFNSGLIQEAQTLASLYPACDALGSIGYKEVLLATEVDPKIVSEQVAQNTRRFAKRQLTWLRNEPIKRNWKIRPDKSSNDELCEVVGDLASFAKPNKIKHIDCLDWDYSKLKSEISNFLSNKPQKGIFIWFVTARKVV